MRDLAKLKKELQEALPSEGLSFILDSLKAILPENAPKLGDLEEIESGYRKLKINRLAGKPEAELAAAEKELEQQALAFIESLEEADFEVGERAEPDEAEDPKLRQGQVLYQIPRKMKFDTETRCIVRIAIEEIDILKDLQTEEDTEVRDNISVSDHMKVEIVDPLAGEAFAIRSTSEPVQFIGDDDYTEWRFYVKPLKKEGTHPLEIKVFVIVNINGKDQVREKTLDETIEIVTEVPVEEAAEAAPFRKPDKPFMLGSAGKAGFMSSRTPISMGGKRTGSTLGGVGQAMLALAFIGVINLMVYIVFPSTQDEYDWLPTIAMGSEKAYKDFAEKHPDSDHYEEAVWRTATTSDDVDAYQDYLDEFGEEGEHSQEAIDALNRLEPNVWDDLSKDPNLVDIDRYIRLFPEGPHRPDVIDELQDTTNWRLPNRDITPRLAQDTAGMLDRLRPLLEPGLPDLELRDPSVSDPNDPVVDPSKPEVDPNGNTDPDSESDPDKKPSDPQDPQGSDDSNTGITGGPDDSGGGDRPGDDEDGQDTDDVGTMGPNPPVKPSGKGTGGYIKPRIDPDAPDSPANTPELPIPPTVEVPGGTFMMGCPDEQEDCPLPELVGGREVTIPTFHIGKYEVTNKEFAAFLSDFGNRSYYQISSTYARIKPVEGGNYEAVEGFEDYPVTEVSWHGAKAYCRWLSRKTGRNYRLPSEAEWEFAARGGSNSQNSFFAGGDLSKAVAWSSENSNRQLHRIGQWAANEVGAHDMSGNANEWCEDQWHETYRGAPTTAAPWVGGSSGQHRVYRGGSAYVNSSFSYVSKRRHYPPGTRHYTLGFRIAY